MDKAVFCGNTYSTFLSSPPSSREREKKKMEPLLNPHTFCLLLFPLLRSYTLGSPAVSHQGKKRRNEGWQKRVSSSSFQHQHQALFLLLCPRRDVTNSPSCQEARRQKKQHCSIRGKRVSQFYAPIAKKLVRTKTLKIYCRKRLLSQKWFRHSERKLEAFLSFFFTRAPFYRTVYWGTTVVVFRRRK